MLIYQRVIIVDIWHINMDMDVSWKGTPLSLDGFHGFSPSINGWFEGRIVGNLHIIHETHWLDHNGIPGI